MTTPADELRTAAAKLRRLADAATPGPWQQTGIGDYGWTVSFSRPGVGVEAEDSDQGRVDANYIAAMHPGVGAEIVKWLDIATEYAERWQPDAQTNSPFRLGALAVARAINGGEQR
ncbi:hypothetical protein ACH4UM_18820 [Streptomyces sp. NPDC020801]|uniref:hypothetical protein n=1 Tax=Streptomyces sp. NPDC020801 TaxID=3365093 RepID=UPI003793A85B